jgi:hypothetical protein
LRILIELNRTQDDRVEGVVSTEGSDETRSFSGWLELLALLEVVGSPTRRNHEREREEQWRT